MALPSSAPQEQPPKERTDPPADQEPPSAPKRRYTQWLAKLVLALLCAVTGGIAKAVAEELLRSWQE